MTMIKIFRSNRSVHKAFRTYVILLNIFQIAKLGPQWFHENNENFSQ